MRACMPASACPHHRFVFLPVFFFSFFFFFLLKLRHNPLVFDVDKRTIMMVALHRCKAMPHSQLAVAQLGTGFLR